MSAPSGSPADVAEVVAFQAAACVRAGSPLYGRILEGVLGDLRAGGVAAALLAGRDDDPFGSALALRLLGAVHRIVLDGRAPELAAHYPSAGGEAEVGDPVAPFLATLREHHDEVADRIDDPVQTNEVARSAVLVGGYAEVARRTGLPLRVLELGASAGLNLRWDHYAYDLGGVVRGDPSSPVRFGGVWVGAAPDLPARFDVAERLGCDRSPLDATTDEGARTLLAYVWPDQPERVERLARGHHGRAARPGRGAGRPRARLGRGAARPAGAGRRHGGGPLHRAAVPLARGAAAPHRSAAPGGPHRHGRGSRGLAAHGALG